MRSHRLTSTLVLVALPVAAGAPPQGSSAVDVEARFDWFEFRSYS